MTKKELKTKKMVVGFDLDGTLIDSMDLHQFAFINAAKEIGFSVSEKDFMKTQGRPIREMILISAPSMTHNDVEKFIVVKEKIVNQHLYMIKPFPDTLKTLHEIGKYATVMILSNSSYPDVLRYLRIAKINPLFFEVIVGSDLVTAPKPSPEELYLAQKLIHHKLSFYVGDSTTDIDTGKNAGIRTIGVATGFNTVKELQSKKPYAVVRVLAELLEVLPLQGKVIHGQKNIAPHIHGWSAHHREMTKIIAPSATQVDFDDIDSLISDIPVPK